MNFPLLNITDTDWDPVRVESKLIFGEFMNIRQELFDRFYQDKLYCDCKGNVYKVVGMISPTSLWSRVFYFVPMVYKSKLIFEETELRLTVDQLRNFVIQRISELPGDEFKRKWIVQLKEATTHQEIINGRIS